MCWVGKMEQRKVAQSDIPCKKVMSFYHKSGQLYAYYMSFHYELGNTYYEVINKKVSLSGWIEVGNGLHCYSNKIALKYTKDGYVACGLTHYTFHGDNNYPVIVNCIIPKGAVYYENALGEIVSTKLKILSIIDNEYYKV